MKYISILLMVLNLVACKTLDTIDLNSLDGVGPVTFDSADLKYMKSNFPIEGFTFNKKAHWTLPLVDVYPSDQILNDRIRYVIQAYQLYLAKSRLKQFKGIEAVEPSLSVLESEKRLLNNFDFIFDAEKRDEVCGPQEACAKFMGQFYDQIALPRKTSIDQSLELINQRQRIVDTANNTSHSITEEIESAPIKKGDRLGGMAYLTEVMTFIYSFDWEFGFSGEPGGLSIVSYQLNINNESKLNGSDEVRVRIGNDRGDLVTTDKLTVHYHEKIGHHVKHRMFTHDFSSVNDVIKDSRTLYVAIIDPESEAILESDAFEFDSDKYHSDFDKLSGLRQDHPKKWADIASRYYGTNIDGHVCGDYLYDYAKSNEIKVGRNYIVKACQNFSMLQSLPHGALFVNRSNDRVPVYVKKEKMLEGVPFHEAGKVFKYLGVDYYQGVYGDMRQALVLEPVK